MDIVQTTRSWLYK